MTGLPLISALFYSAHSFMRFLGRSYCSKGKKVCQGQPCLVITPATTPLPPTTTGRLSTCRTGWSDWFNSHQPQSDADLFDVEPLPQDWLVVRPQLRL